MGQQVYSTPQKLWPALLAPSPISKIVICNLNLFEPDLKNTFFPSENQIFPFIKKITWTQQLSTNLFSKPKMSLSHLNFSARSDALPEPDQEEVQIRRQIHESHYNEFFDETKFRNPDDVSKVPGLVPKQHEEVERLKVQFRRANEIYLRSHPEINSMISVFLCKLLEEQPENILSYAGKFFDNDNLQSVIDIELNHYFGDDDGADNK
jgi:hypothetical protein